MQRGKLLRKNISSDEIFLIEWYQYVDGEGILHGLRNFYLYDKREANERAKKYHRKNREKILIRRRKEYKKYYKDNREKELNRLKKYYQENRIEILEDRKAYSKKYYESNKEKILLNISEYAQTEKGKLARRKAVAKCNHKRRGLGFIALNQKFKGAHAHHIDKNCIIFIPKELHLSIKHNLWSNIGMEEINRKAFAFMILQLFKIKKDKNE